MTRSRRPSAQTLRVLAPSLLIRSSGATATSSAPKSVSARARSIRSSCGSATASCSRLRGRATRRRGRPPRHLYRLTASGREYAALHASAPARCRAGSRRPSSGAHRRRSLPPRAARPRGRARGACRPARAGAAVARRRSRGRLARAGGPRPAAERAEWGAAMCAELAGVQGARRRWGFSLGCCQGGARLRLRASSPRPAAAAAACAPRSCARSRRRSRSASTGSCAIRHCAQLRPLGRAGLLARAPARLCGRRAHALARRGGAGGRCAPLRPRRRPCVGAAWLLVVAPVPPRISKNLVFVPLAAALLVPAAVAALAGRSSAGCAGGHGGRALERTLRRPARVHRLGDGDVRERRPALRRPDAARLPRTAARTISPPTRSATTSARPSACS